MRLHNLWTFVAFVSAARSDGTDWTTGSAQDRVKKGIAALGGYDALRSLKGVSSHCHEYRSASLEESYVPDESDTFIAESGHQTVSYDFSSDNVVQRVERGYQISNYWYFGRQHLPPVEASLVTRGGPKGYSCYVHGNEAQYSNTSDVYGYVDAYHANVLLRDAIRLSPRLLLDMAEKGQLKATNITSNGVSYPAVTDLALNLTVGFDTKTALPTIIRAKEEHKIFGLSTSDFKLNNYTAVAGHKFPKHVQHYYNEVNLLQDQYYDKFEVNPTFPKGYFDGLPSAQINSTTQKFPPAAARDSSEYGIAEVFENTQNMLWHGTYKGRLDRITVTKPHPELPDLWHLVFNDAPGYTTTILNFEDAVMVTDAPAHQSKLVIRWIEENLHKKPTHLLVTHHHHDHNYGAADYVAVGAKLVVPEDYKHYWTSIPGVKFETATEDKPFIHKSASMQVRGVYPGVGQVHSADWMYFTFTVGCPKKDSLMAVELADVWSPYFFSDLFDEFEATKYLKIAARHRVPRNNLVIPLHGAPTNGTDLYVLTGFDYPDHGILDFLPGGPWC